MNVGKQNISLIFKRFFYPLNINHFSTDEIQYVQYNCVVFTLKRSDTNTRYN
jgi:hypothetical protein